MNVLHFKGLDDGVGLSEAVFTDADVRRAYRGEGYPHLSAHSRPRQPT